MKNWKSLLCIGLTISIMSAPLSYAEMTVPPHPTGEEGTAGNTTAGNLLPGQGLPGGVLGAESGVLTAGSPVTGSAGTMPKGPGTVGSSVEGPGTSPGGPGMAEGQQSPEGTTAGGQAVAGAGGQQRPEEAAAGGQQTPEEAGTGGQASAAQALQEPEIAAEGAVLIDGATGKVLYGKNADQSFYPASITKVMTALLTLEHCSLSDVVTFSASATTNLESGAVSLDITEGDRLTVEQCLYGLLMKSANEIGNGLAEHIAGSVPNFAQMMNDKARELGCTNTNFVNPHGLNNAAHKTSPHDMALIMRAALQNEIFRKITTTRTYEFPATKKAAARTITMGHKMIYPSDSRYYEGVIGGKTGYTSLAGNTLVTGAERNGVQLIVVIMKSKQTHYADTRVLLDYGFANYAALMAR